MEYWVPGVTGKVTQLCDPPWAQSSLKATRVRAVTALPVYTASRVSKSLPARET